MSLMRPFTPGQTDLDRVFNELEQEFMSPWFGGRGRRYFEPTREFAVTTFAPPVNVIEEEKDVKVKAVVPGIKPENLEIEVTEHTLTISGEAKKEEAEEKGNFYRREISHANLYRRIELPTDVDGNKAKADFENGILTVTIPKLEQTQRHRIKISSK